MVFIHHAGLTDLGQVREQNEDRWFADPDNGLYVVADGMGGHLGGEVASRIVVEVLPELVRRKFKDIGDLSEPNTEKELMSLLSELSNRLRNVSKESRDLSGMGSTVVLLLVRGSYGLIGQMGDSRAYRLKNGKLEQLTHDHTLVQLLIDTGELTADEAAKHPSRGQVTRYMGMEDDPLPEARTVEIESGDLFLLCSDGLTGMLENEKILSILTKKKGLDDTCRALIASANDAGGKDNITAVLIQVGSGDDSKSDSSK